MPREKGFLERAKKTLVYVYRRLITFCAAIIEEGGVGGSRAQATFSRERFFLHTPESTLGNKNLFVYRFYSSFESTQHSKVTLSTQH